MSNEKSSSPQATTAKQHAERLRQQIVTLNREPFREVLSVFLGAAPSPASIKKFADKSPDRWAQAIAIMTKAAGYHEGVVGAARNETNIYLQLQSKSDAEVLTMLENMLHTYGIPTEMMAKLDPRNLIEAEVISKEEGPEGP